MTARNASAGDSAAGRVPAAGSESAVVVFGLVLLGLCGAFAGLLEALLVPLYAGSVPIPLTVLLAVGGNIALPRLARSLRASMAAACVPLATWLLVVVVFGVVARPEGDVILPGGDLQWVTYSMVLGGAVAGMFTAALTGLPPRRVEPGAGAGARAKNAQSAGSRR